MAHFLRPILEPDKPDKIKCLDPSEEVWKQINNVSIPQRKFEHLPPSPTGEFSYNPNVIIQTI